MASPARSSRPQQCTAGSAARSLLLAPAASPSSCAATASYGGLRWPVRPTTRRRPAPQSCPPRVAACLTGWEAPDRRGAADDRVADGAPAASARDPYYLLHYAEPDAPQPDGGPHPHSPDPTEPSTTVCCCAACCLRQRARSPATSAAAAVLLSFCVSCLRACRLTTCPTSPCFIVQPLTSSPPPQGVKLASGQFSVAAPSKVRYVRVEPSGANKKSFPRGAPMQHLASAVSESKGLKGPFQPLDKDSYFYFPENAARVVSRKCGCRPMPSSSRPFSAAAVVVPRPLQPPHVHTCPHPAALGAIPLAAC